MREKNDKNQDKEGSSGEESKGLLGTVGTQLLVGIIKRGGFYVFSLFQREVTAV